MVIAVSTVAVLFFAMGLAALIRPAFVVGLYSLRPDTADARNEVRAVYGGFGLVMGGLLLLALRDEALRPGILLSVGVALAGMAAGRLIGFAIERTGPIPVITCLAELALAALLLMWLF